SSDAPKQRSGPRPALSTPVRPCPSQISKSSPFAVRCSPAPLPRSPLPSRWCLEKSGAHKEYLTDQDIRVREVSFVPISSLPDLCRLCGVFLILLPVTRTFALLYYATPSLLLDYCQLKAKKKSTTTLL